MNWRLTLHILGGLHLFLAATLLVPVPFSLLFGDGVHLAFLAPAGLTALVGIVLWLAFPADGVLGRREGTGIVTLGWLLFALYGGLPYALAEPHLGPAQCFFEAMSGFTTTGATVIANIDAVPHSVLLWRATTQWIGGMGIIVLGLAILPFLGVGGMQLFQFEAPGPTADRLRPRIEDTAKVLWAVYLGLTLLLIALLVLGGMNVFEAVCHAFTTMSTGGFSTENASVAAWSSSYIHVVITVFMAIAGLNFALHYAVLTGQARRFWRSEEMRGFLTLIVVAIALIFALVLPSYRSGWIALRDSAFQVTSIVTTTGFGTADYETWPPAAQLILLLLMVIGGCAGSTAGGIKVVRVLIVAKHAWLQVIRSIHPRAVKVLRFEGAVVPREIARSVLGFFALYVMLLVVITIVVAALGTDIVTAAGATAACLGNIGPGLGLVGPTEHYAHLGSPTHLVLAAAMLLGRLEVFTVLALLLPSFWRR